MWAMIVCSIWGQMGHSVSMCPTLNAKGTIYITIQLFLDGVVRFQERKCRIRRVAIWEIRYIVELRIESFVLNYVFITKFFQMF